MTKLCDYFQVGHLYELEVRSYIKSDVPEVSKYVLILKTITREHTIKAFSGKKMMIMSYLDDPLEEPSHYLYDKSMVKCLKRIS
jgi:hypothetical protein